MTVFTDRAGSFWYLEGFIDSSHERWRTVIDTLRRRETVASLVTMTRGSGIGPIAEGIETESEEAACRQVGFEVAQGYRLGLPMLLSELLEGG